MKRNIILFFVLSLFLLPIILAADCPNGLVNDVYPGDCNLYTDINGDRICDHSQTVEEAKQLTQPVQIKPSLIKTYYNFLIIAIIVIVLYLLSSILSRAGKIYPPITHKKIWNFLLLISFLGVGISGLLSVLRIEFGINLSWFPNLLFWHVETGIVMALIAIFHILWHWGYFKSYFSINRKSPIPENN